MSRSPENLDGPVGAALVGGVVVGGVGRFAVEFTDGGIVEVAGGVALLNVLLSFGFG